MDLRFDKKYGVSLCLKLHVILSSDKNKNNFMLRLIFTNPLPTKNQMKIKTISLCAYNKYYKV